MLGGGRWRGWAGCEGAGSRCRRGACVGVVQMVLAGKEAQESVREVCQLLASPTTQEAEQLYDVISNWAEMNGIAEISM